MGTPPPVHHARGPTLELRVNPDFVEPTPPRELQTPITKCHVSRPQRFEESYTPEPPPVPNAESIAMDEPPVEDNEHRVNAYGRIRRLENYVASTINEPKFMTEWILLIKPMLTRVEADYLAAKYAKRTPEILLSARGTLAGERLDYRNFMRWLIRTGGILCKSMKLSVLRRKEVWRVAILALVRRNGPAWASCAEQVLQNKHRNPEFDSLLKKRKKKKKKKKDRELSPRKAASAVDVDLTLEPLSLGPGGALPSQFNPFNPSGGVVGAGLRDLLKSSSDKPLGQDVSQDLTPAQRRLEQKIIQVQSTAKRMQVAYFVLVIDM